MNIGWYVKRLKAMNKDEVLWRLSQKRLNAGEKNVFKKIKIAVTDGVHYPELDELVLHPERIYITDPESLKDYFNGDRPLTSNGDRPLTLTSVGDRPLTSNGDRPSFDAFIENTSIPLLGGFSYEENKTNWHGGFNTSNEWPLVYSAELNYRQRDDIGDARTNWELNRHFQFPLLAARFYYTGNIDHLLELGALFTDWNEKNPFLWGISWTSVMEVAIRLINWCYTVAFLGRAFANLPESTRGTDPDDALGTDPGDALGTDPDDALGTDPEKTLGTDPDDASDPDPEKTLGTDPDLADDTEMSDEAQLLSALLDGLSCGIINMASYVANHFSRHSSANNHTIIEACALGFAGIIADYEPWSYICDSLLFEELQKQNYKDGVNKEMSLHYQSFVMEGVGLLALTRLSNGLRIPQLWRNTLVSMSRYLAWCMGSFGETIVFGDDDEGKIIDIAGIHRDHYRYVAQLMSLILPERYADEMSDMTLMCITMGKMVTSMSSKPHYSPKGSSNTFEQGGITIFRSTQNQHRKILAGFDHGPLGYGSIAAHGHADSLSFQLYRDGEAVFADPGTYIYHIDIESRNLFRKTSMHNTLCLCDKDQSQMEGAFLWGRKAETTLVSQLSAPDSEDGTQTGTAHSFIEAEHTGYFPVIHRRKVSFDGESGFIIRDRLLNVKSREKAPFFEINFMLGPGFDVDIDEKEGQCVIKKEDEPILRLRPESSTELFIALRTVPYSKCYGVKEDVKQLVIKGQALTDIDVVTKIKVL